MDVELVQLQPWGEGDFWLLERNNSLEMTAHLGGPESAAQLDARHRRYVGLERGCMYRVELAGSGETVGSIGFWEREWRGESVWETGWGVLPEFQGRGPMGGTGICMPFRASAIPRRTRCAGKPGSPCSVRWSSSTPRGAG